MTYLYENLGPDRFQQFCQALLIKCFPSLQCYPIRQPDGGRDALAFYGPGDDGAGSIVFQVKYVLKPFAEQRPHNWLSDVLVEEAEKLQKLIPKGAKEYYLLTNIPGTAHLGSGSIDTVAAILSTRMSVPAYCWWRDDLDRRLDNLWELKWSYPELLSAQDVLGYLVQSRLTADGQPRMAAIRAFIRDQYEIDKEVRFKQIELQNRLLDLFIDVPVSLRSQVDHKIRPLYLDILTDFQQWAVNPERGQSLRTRQISQRHLFSSDPDSAIGAASLLLHPAFQEQFPLIVLEGAPGQGKSTIAQYICQVHRMKLLGVSEALGQIAQGHKWSALRIPFKVDLRDYATWLNRQNPFSADDAGVLPEGWRKSLESFLAAQVRHHSGGMAFSVDDLISLAQVSPMLVMLDGLDEVADITTREEVVREVVSGINRLKANAPALQAIITSRPAAFANSPGFPEKLFPHFELNSIDRKSIDEYADKWMNARRLNPRERGDVLRILKSKLDEPHLRDLARNPMQLAILLSLIHTRGSSLPDKRTALYDSYMELFFNRESEKSALVREHRDLLVDIHQYLAWILHSEAEVGNSRGSISAEKLRRLLSNYLEAEGRDVSLASKLFTGMIERVVALVSRVQGTYEFEVQPLREYFAARFLYETAPYSPPGAEAKGTKPDRFDAIARNFYWLNVARFYAGCYSKGELPSLADSLTVLCQEEGFRFINHPRVLSATLLADWVFSQNARSMRQVIGLLLDGIGLRYVTTPRSAALRRGDTLVLPKDCGRNELIEQCFELLATYPVRDYALELIDLVAANSDIESRTELWQSHLKQMLAQERTKWIEYGLYMGILAKLPVNELQEIICDTVDERSRLNSILRAGRTDFFEDSEERAKKIVDSILDGEIVPRPSPSKRSIIFNLAQSLAPIRHDMLSQAPPHMPVIEIRRHPWFDPIDDNEPNLVTNFDIFSKCYGVVQTARRQLERTVGEWSCTLEPWEAIVEESRAMFGERWVIYRLANQASGIRARDITCKEYSGLFDRSMPLCRRARYARLRAGNVVYWKQQLDLATTEVELQFALLILLTWGSSKVLTALAQTIDEKLVSITSDNWSRLARSLRSATHTPFDPDRGGTVELEITALPDSLSERTVTAFGVRADEKTVQSLVERYFYQYKGDDPFALSIMQQTAIEHIMDPNVNESERWLSIIARSYLQGIFADTLKINHAIRNRDNVIQLDVAKAIAGNPDKYPRYLVAVAESRCGTDVASQIIPVSETAKSDGWFVH